MEIIFILITLYLLGNYGAHALRGYELSNKVVILTVVWLVLMFIIGAKNV